MNTKNPNLCTNSYCSYKTSTLAIIKEDQRLHFNDILAYFDNPNANVEPQLVRQLNLSMDTDGIVRVKSKFGKLKANNSLRNPILLHKESALTKLLITDYHVQFMHAGIY